MQPRTTEEEAYSESQRQFDRVEVRFPARLKKENLGDEQDVVIKDFSPEGAKILTIQKLSLFDRLSVSFTATKDPSHPPFQGHVVWVDREGPETWHAGIKFDQVDLLRASRIMAYGRQSF